MAEQVEADSKSRSTTFFQMFVEERLVLTIIVLNAVVLFLKAFPGWNSSVHSVLWNVDYACTIYFFVEMFIKVAHHGFRGYWHSGWNRFDFVVVVASTPHLLSPVLDLESFAIILVLRTARLARLMRLMHFIPDRERLWHGMLRALRASVGVLIALVVYNFILGLTACYLFRETGSPYFKNPLSSMYALFQVFTVEGWHEIPESIALDSSPGMAALVRVFFVFAVLTGGLLGISLANAVFVDEMVMDNTDDLERHIAELRAEVSAAREQGERDSERLARAIERLADRLPSEDPQNEPSPLGAPPGEDPPSGA